MKSVTKTSLMLGLIPQKDSSESISKQPPVRWVPPDEIETLWNVAPSALVAKAEAEQVLINAERERDS